MKYTAEIIERLRQDGKLQTYLQNEQGVVAKLRLASVVEHRATALGSESLHVGCVTGQCWIEPYQGDGGAVCMKYEGSETESWSLARFESPHQALEQARQHLIDTMQKARMAALAQAQARLEVLQAAAA